MNDLKDRVSLRKEYEQKVPREGTCGPTLVALLLNKSVKEIIDNWRIPYKGYCSFRELEREINKYGIETKRVKSENKRDYVLPEGVKTAIARIKWKKKYSNWTIPEKNTHFIYLKQKDDKIQLFDSEIGWFNIESKGAKEYLKRGKLNSFIILN